MDRQVHRPAADAPQVRNHLRLVDDVLRHLPVGGPFAPGDRDETRFRDDDGVIPRKRGGIPPTSRLDERPESGEHGTDILRTGIPRQVARGLLHDEGAFLRERPGLEEGFVHRGVSRTHHDMIMPRNREKHPPVLGLRDHDSGIPGQKLLGQHEMNPLRYREQPRTVRIVHPPQGVGKNPGCVDHTGRANFKRLAALGIRCPDTGDHPVLLEQSVAPHVVGENPALVGRRPGQIDGQPGIIELPVMINDPALETVRFHRRDQLDRLLLCEDPRRAQPQSAGHPVVHLHADSVKRALPPAIIGNDKRHVVDEVGGIPIKPSAFPQRLQDEGNVTLPEVADASMDQLGAAARGSLRKVRLLDQRHPVPPAGGIDRRAQSGGPATHDQQIKRLAGSKGLQ